MAKIMISIDDELLQRVEAMAKAHYTNRSAFISITLAQVLNTQEKTMGLVKKTLEDGLKSQITISELEKELK